MISYIWDVIWENLAPGQKINILSFKYHLNNFNLLFLKPIKVCLYDTYIQSYVFIKVIKI